jgi:thioredoxin-like negative regulator of GroEL
METIENIRDFINNEQIALLYLTTTDCNVCKVLKPKIQDICCEFELVKDKYIDIDDLPELKGEFSVFAAPTMILFIEGKETLRFSRNIDLYDFRQKLERYVDLLTSEI